MLPLGKVGEGHVRSLLFLITAYEDIYIYEIYIRI